MLSLRGVPFNTEAYHDATLVLNPEDADRGVIFVNIYTS